jgi:Lrp/AsnC family transcriptional regulator, leucine-responsive regulatory protein
MIIRILHLCPVRVGELQRDGRVSWAELGRRVNLTPPAVADRVTRLERDGVITGYRAQIDLARVGRPTLAFVRIRVGGDRRLERTRALAEQLPQVLECHRVTGEDCYVLKVAVAGTTELETLVDQLITIGDPITSIVMSTQVACRDLGAPGHRPNLAALPARAG